MGWWSSLVDGVSNAAGWVIDNASTIGTVVSTVGKVASLIPLAEDEKVDDITESSGEKPFDMPVFINTMGRAEEVLKAAATGASQQRLKSFHRGGKSTTTTEQLCSGLWAKPITDLNGVSAQGMTSDLSHMVAMADFPQTLRIGKTEEDVAQRLGQSIFNGNPILPLEAAPNQKPYDVVTASLTSDDGADTIVCSHAYYAIPSGGEGNEKSWHSAISLSTVQTTESKRAYHKARLHAAKVPAPLKLSEEDLVDLGNVWQVTLNILWTAATYALKAAPLVANYILASGSVLEIKYINTDGLTTFIQIKAAPNVTPVQAREVVLSAANDAVIDVEAQIPGVTNKKSRSASKLPSSGLTQVDILANKLMPADEHSTSGTATSRRSIANGSANGKSHGAKNSTGQRRLVTFKPFDGEFGDGFDPADFEDDGAQFYVPLFPVNSRKKVAQNLVLLWSCQS